jgi:hypothetical protein
MTVGSNEQVVFRNYPLMFWLFGFIPVLVALFTHAPAWKRVLFFVAGVGLIGISSILTVTITLANLEIALSSALSRKPPGSHKLFYGRHRLHRKVGRGSC